jgi:type I restriction enzyme M protein
MPSTWFVAETNDVVYSSIDFWKGCIAVVPPEFAGGLVTKEFPVYRVTAANLLPEFLQVLLRSRPYQRAFRAITTGHSNRRRTQQDDFEALEIIYPPDPGEQRRLIADIVAARRSQAEAAWTLHREMVAFSTLIDSRGEEELPEVVAESENGENGE